MVSYLSNKKGSKMTLMIAGGRGKDELPIPRARKDGMPRLISGLPRPYKRTIRRGDDSFFSGGGVSSCGRKRRRNHPLSIFKFIT
jgi:hypothetical protein